MTRHSFITASKALHSSDKVEHRTQSIDNFALIVFTIVVCVSFFYTDIASVSLGCCREKQEIEHKREQ